MALESAVFLNDLNSSNPDGADAKSQGDDHVRMMKAVLKTTFPGLAGAAWRSQTKSSGYTPIATDNLSLLNCTAALTLSMTAAATLGNGYLLAVHANGGDVTIDPNAAETVNGVATFQIPNGFMGLVFCNGTSFVAGMFPVSSGSVWSTGDVKSTLKTVADTGWVMMNDGTIGDATSGGTTRANADTLNLFTLLWTNTADAQCAVSTGRGASAAVDFAAHKTIALPKALGRALASAGAGSGLTSRALALAVGSENAVLVSHNHTYSGSTDAQGTHDHASQIEYPGGGGATGSDLDASGVQVSSAGRINALPTNSNARTSSNGSHAHNFSGSTSTDGSGATGANMQPSFFINFMIKL